VRPRVHSRPPVFVVVRSGRGTLTHCAPARRLIGGIDGSPSSPGSDDGGGRGRPGAGRHGEGGGGGAAAVGDAPTAGHGVGQRYSEQYYREREAEVATPARYSGAYAAALERTRREASERAALEVKDSENRVLERRSQEVSEVAQQGRARDRVRVRARARARARAVPRRQWWEWRPACLTVAIWLQAHRKVEEAQRQLEEDGTLDDIEALISSMDGGELDSLMELRGGAAAAGGGFDEL
jgi:hypothetical protein